MSYTIIDFLLCSWNFCIRLIVNQLTEFRAPHSNGEGNYAKVYHLYHDVTNLMIGMRTDIWTISENSLWNMSLSLSVYLLSQGWNLHFLFAKGIKISSRTPNVYLNRNSRNRLGKMNFLHHSSDRWDEAKRVYTRCQCGGYKSDDGMAVSYWSQFKLPLQE